jgi:hypothetical protein
MSEFDDRLFAIGTEIAETLLSRLRGPQPKSDFRTAMLFFFCQAYKTYQAMRILWKAGYIEDATRDAVLSETGVSRLRT